MSALGEWWAPWFGGWQVVLQAVNFLVSFALVTVVFAWASPSSPCGKRTKCFPRKG
jgi:membrane protein